MNWKDIIKEDKMFEEVKNDFINFVDEVIEKIKEEDLGWGMYSYFDGLNPQYIEDSERLNKKIKSVMRDYSDNPFVDGKALLSMLNRLNQKENLRNLVDAFKE